MQHREDHHVTGKGGIGKDESALEQQVQELSQGKEDLEGKVDKMSAGNEFWAEKGAESMVTTCLKSPELYH